jgi:hypothetical protein
VGRALRKPFLPYSSYLFILYFIQGRLLSATAYNVILVSHPKVVAFAYIPPGTRGRFLLLWMHNNRILITEIGHLRFSGSLTSYGGRLNYL